MTKTKANKDEGYITNYGMSAKKKLLIAAIVIVLLIAIGILVAVLFTTTIINQEVVDATAQISSTCGNTVCVHGSCRCTGAESICVCYANYTGDSCDTLRSPGCSGDNACLRSRGPPKPDRGWYTVGGSEYEYLLIRSLHNWKTSRRICQRYGGDLAWMGIRNDALKIATSVELFGGRNVWIGLQKEDGRRWTWVNGDLAFNANWLPDQPRNDYRNRDNCAVLDGSENEYGSINLNCNSKYYSLCEKRVEN